MNNIKNLTINDVYLDYVNFLSINYKPTTVLQTKRKFKNYILPTFGEMYVLEINKTEYIDFLVYIQGLNYSSSFLTKMKSIMKGLYDYLEIVYSIENIPKKVNKMFKCTDERKAIKNIWSKKTFDKFIRVVDDQVYKALFTTLFFTGIRKGEALALQIKDFNNQTLTVSENLSKEQFGGKRIHLSTKNGKTRYIKVDFFTNLELKKLVKYYKKEYPNFNNDFYLFGADKPLATTTLDRKKNYFCDLAGVNRIRIHDFRHSHATMLHKNKIKVKLIQERLGHSDISTTLNTYIHTCENEEKRLINKINLLRL